MCLRSHLARRCRRVVARQHRPAANPRTLLKLPAEKQLPVTSSFHSRPTLAFVGLFLATQVVVPMFWGDVYPFSSAPMFRDRPERFSDYRVLMADGTELPQEGWLVQRIYDGNPVGYGTG